MESCPWGVLLLCGVAVAATALAPPQEPPLSHEEALSLAVGLYNQESETGFAFRLLEAKPQPEWLVKKCAGTLAVVARGIIQLDCETAAEGHIRRVVRMVDRFPYQVEEAMRKFVEELEKVLKKG